MKEHGKRVHMVDQDKVREAIRLLLEGIGEDPTREGLVETPDRVARMYTELAGGMDANASEHLSKTFAVSDNGLVIERDIPFYSLCEHHMLPFYGHATIGYIPNGRVAGLMDAEHLCMTMRGVQKPGTKTTTLVRRGVFAEPGSEGHQWEERFFRMLGR